MADKEYNEIMEILLNKQWEDLSKEEQLLIESYLSGNDIINDSYLISELVDQEITHDQLVPIAERLLKSTDPLSRIRAIQVLGKMQNAAIRKKIYNLAKDDPHHVVRHAAKQLLSL